ncbi:hypothetical protein ECSTEC94C_2413 [Escherichia coli STEC_94C]|nr:hypothetical protein ECSTEC94C_2413 [Escherichia coli STEC_94C]
MYLLLISYICFDNVLFIEINLNNQCLRDLKEPRFINVWKSSQSNKVDFQ